MDSSIRHGAITSATELAPSLQEGNAKPRGLSIARSGPEVRPVGARQKQLRRALALGDELRKPRRLTRDASSSSVACVSAVEAKTIARDEDG